MSFWPIFVKKWSFKKKGEKCWVVSLKLSNIKSTICRWKKKTKVCWFFLTCGNHESKGCAPYPKKRPMNQKRESFCKISWFLWKIMGFKNGFKGQKRLSAIWKALLKITLVDACFSMSFFNFKTPMQNKTFFEKQNVIGFVYI